MPVWLEDELRRGATSIEAKASPFRAQELFRCSILLTAETRASLLKVQDASRKAIPNSVSHRLSPCPVLCNESAERTLLAHRFILYSIYKEKYKKTPHLQRTRSPRCHLCWLLLRNPLTGWAVVYPSSTVTEWKPPKPTLSAFRFGARKPIHLPFLTGLHQPPVLWAETISYSSSSSLISVHFS